MQIKKKRTEINSETRMLLILENSNGGRRQGWCGQCGKNVFWFAPEEIELFGISGAMTGALHKNGDFICSRSLVEEIKKGEIR